MSEEIKNLCLVGIHKDTGCLEIICSIKNQEHLTDHLETIKQDKYLPYIVNTEKAKAAWGSRVLDYKNLI